MHLFSKSDLRDLLHIPLNISVRIYHLVGELIPKLKALAFYM